MSRLAAIQIRAATGNEKRDQRNEEQSNLRTVEIGQNQITQNRIRQNPAGWLTVGQGAINVCIASAVTC